MKTTKRLAHAIACYSKKDAALCLGALWLALHLQRLRLAWTEKAEHLTFPVIARFCHGGFCVRPFKVARLSRLGDQKEQ